MSAYPFNHEANTSLFGVSLYSSLNTINIICENYEDQFDSLSEAEVAFLKASLAKINHRVNQISRRFSISSSDSAHIAQGSDPRDKNHESMGDQPEEKTSENEEVSRNLIETNDSCNGETRDSSTSEGNLGNLIPIEESSEETEYQQEDEGFENDSKNDDKDSSQIEGQKSNSLSPRISKPTSVPRRKLSKGMPGPPRFRKISLKSKNDVSGKKSLIHPQLIEAARNHGTKIGPGGELDDLNDFAKNNHDTRIRNSSMRAKHDINANTESWTKMAKEAFKIIDANNDGFLQKQEVISAIAKMQENGKMGLDHFDCVELAEKMMADVDLDGNGEIDIDEFIKMMRKSVVDDSVSAGDLFLNNRMSQLAKNVLLAHEKKLETNIIGEDHWMIHPLSTLHAFWDIMVSILISLTVITMPLSLGWDELNEALFSANLSVDFIFLLDVCINFCTGFIDENDAVIMDAKVVRWNYLTGFFITDFCSSIPFDLILKAAGVESDTGAVSGTKHSLKMLKLVRITKLFRLLRISRLFRHVKRAVLLLEENFRIRISDGFTKLLRLGVGALVLAHWIGCFNFMLVRLNDFPEDSWLVYAGLLDKDPYTQWTWSFFKALAQMIMIGFETPPFTNASCDTATKWCGIEHWVTLGCLYIGAVFYSLLISSVSSILQTASLASRRFEEKLIQIDDYMRTKKLPAPLREKVKDYFHLKHTDGKLFDEAEILETVTPILRREINTFNRRDLTMKVPMLSTATNRNFAEDMATKIEPTLAFADETLVRENTTGDEMFFIHNGVVEIIPGARNCTYVAIGDGCYFGEVSLLLGIKRTASARSKTQCTLYKVFKNDLLAVLQDHPDTENSMKKVAMSRKRRLAHYVDPKSNPLSPQDEIDAEDCKTELFGVDTDKVAQKKEEAFEKTRRSAYIKPGPRKTIVQQQQQARRASVQHARRHSFVGVIDSEGN